MAYDEDPKLALKDGAILRVCPNPECPNDGEQVPFFCLANGSGLWYCTYCLEEFPLDELKKEVGT